MKEDVAEGSRSFASCGNGLPCGTKLGLRIVLQPIAEASYHCCTTVAVQAVQGFIHQ